jgi:FtsH-binding integral membrane protein
MKPETPIIKLSDQSVFKINSPAFVAGQLAELILKPVSGLYCLLTPLMASAFPALEQFSGRAQFLLLVVILPLALSAMWTGYQKHRKLSPGIMLGIGTICLSLAFFLSPVGLHFTQETSLHIIGSGLIFWGICFNQLAADRSGDDQWL